MVEMSGGDSMAWFFSFGPVLFYSSFLEGELFELGEKYQDADYTDITEEIKERYPGFLEEKFPIICNNFIKMRSKDNITHDGTYSDNISTANLVMDNENYELPNSDDYLNLYLELEKGEDTITILALPKSQRIIRLNI